MPIFYSMISKTNVLMVDISRHLIWLSWLRWSPVQPVRISGNCHTRVRWITSWRDAERCHLAVHLYTTHIQCLDNSMQTKQTRDLANSHKQQMSQKNTQLYCTPCRPRLWKCSHCKPKPWVLLNACHCLTSLLLKYCILHAFHSFFHWLNIIFKIWWPFHGAASPKASALC